MAGNKSLFRLRKARTVGLALTAVLLFFASLGLAQDPNVCQVGQTCTASITTAGSTCSVSTSCLSLPLPSNTSGISIAVTGTFTGTLQFEQSADYGTTWIAASVSPPTGAAVTSATATGLWTYSLSGQTNFRVRASALASGSPNVTFSTSNAAVAGITTAAGVINLFTSCSGTQYLGADGACHSASSSSGTVTSFSAGDLSPIFTTTEATPTTTPALSFVLTNAAAGTVLGNATGSAAGPTYTPTPILGLSGTTQGTLTLDGLTSGALIVTTQSVAGTPTWTAGTSSGTPVVAASAPLAITAATGNIVVTGAAGQVLGGATPAFTATPALGTDNSVAGTLQLANSAANAHTIWSSGATTTNTIAGFTAVPVTGDLVSCASATTVCTLTDSGVLAANVVTAAGTLTSTGVLLGGGTKAAVVSDVTYVTPTLTGPVAFKLTSADTTPVTEIFAAGNVTFSGSGNPAINLKTTTAGTNQFPQFQFMDSTGTAKVALTAQTNGALFIDSGGSTISLRSAVGSTNIATFSAAATVISAGTFAAGNGKFGVDTSGKVTSYNNVSTTGVGIPFTFGASDVTNQTASQTIVNLTASTPASGSYTIHYYADEKTACSTVAAGGVLFTFSWTDGTLARTFATATLNADTTGVAASYIQGTVSLFSATASVISYTSTYNATCATGGPFAYDAHIWLTEDK